MKDVVSEAFMRGWIGKDAFEILFSEAVAAEQVTARNQARRARLEARRAERRLARRIARYVR